MSRFAGIPADAVAFYAELCDEGADNNSREWFARNKERYELSVREPIAALADALADEFGESKIFRPHRDVRFAKDKSPLKTEQGAVVQDSEGTGFYVAVGADGLLTGGGAMHLTPDQLVRYRSAVDDDRSGTDLARTIEALRGNGFQIGGEVLKTRPRGVAPDHPRLELMRHKGIIAWREHGTPRWMSTAGVVRHVRDDWRAVGPLARWFEDNVGPSQETGEERARRRP